MKHLILCLSILLFYSIENAAAQQKGNSEHKCYLGVSFSPDYCYRILTLNQDNLQDQTASNRLIGIRNENETAKIGYTLATKVHVSANKHWSLESGLQFSNIGYKSVLPTRYAFNSSFEPTRGFVNPTIEPAYPITQINFYYNHYYLSVPIRLLYTLGENKTKFISSAGVNAGYLVASNLRIKEHMANGSVKKQTESQHEDFNKFNLFATLSAGARFQLNNKMFLSTEAQFNVGTLKIINTPITAYLWHSNLSVSCYRLINH